MSDQSAIEWTNASWNPVTGCTKLSAGCDHCYAERFAERFRGVPGHPFETGFDLTLRPERLDQPARWRRSRLIFVNSMSDLFHKSVPTAFIGQVFDAMEEAHWHTYQVLTKRSSLMRDFVNKRYGGKPAPGHIWLGVSIEDKAALGRLRHLKQTDASVRFVSFEPLLGPLGDVDLTGIDWVIAGGESGAGARPVEVDWLRQIRDGCQRQGVAFFFKQWGGRTPKAGGNVLDGKRWQQYPSVEAIESGWWVENRQRAAGAPVEVREMEVGPWAREKLECLRKYLEAYTTILSKQAWCKRYFYIDAFAGPGVLKVRDETSDPAQLSLLQAASHAADDPHEREYIAGSPNVALGVAHQFTDYVFVEKDEDRIEELRALEKAHEATTRVHIRNEDCNEYLRHFLGRSRGLWRQMRGVVFLDPFGMQVPWNTIAALGRTQKIEVFINFPVGMAIQRLLPRSGEFTKKHRDKLDRYFGTNEWFDMAYDSHDGLLGEQVTKRRKTGDEIVRWYRDRLKTVFAEVSAAREVRLPNGRPLYYLIFAGHNATGRRIADNILKHGARVVR